ncbi:MAG: hypothetical protein PARBA_02665 [Parabacteroides sp.]
MENPTYQPNADYVAACGLYCGACRSFIKKQCPGCRANVKAKWCKIRQCNQEHGYKSCADCTVSSIDTCKKFNNFMGKIFSVLFRSDRSACIRRIQAVGYDTFASEMHGKGQQTIKR